MSIDIGFMLSWMWYPVTNMLKRTKSGPKEGFKSFKQNWIEIVVSYFRRRADISIIEKVLRFRTEYIR
jgi:hypothetical protein